MKPRLPRSFWKLSEPSDYNRGLLPVSFDVPQGCIVFRHFESQSWFWKEMFHDRYVLLINLGSPGRIILDHTEFGFPAGKMILIFPYQIHVYKVIDEPIKWMTITFRQQDPRGLTMLKNRLIRMNGNDEELIEQIIETYCEKDYGKKAESNVANRVALLISLLLSSMLSAADSCVDQSKNPNTNSLVEEVGRFVNDNMTRRITPAQIARHAGLSESHFRLLFRNCTRIPIGKYIERCRLARAEYLLKHSRKNISEVAYACGYQSAVSFIRMFKRYHRFSPSRFRKNADSD